jgi:protein-S-isoprenylcysteine O-methyltransferase Ste14
MLERHKTTHFGCFMHEVKPTIPPPVVTLVWAFIIGSLSLVTPVVGADATLRIAATLSTLSFALVVIGLGVHSFKRVRTTINPLQPEKASTLVTSGIYRWTRNPMYLGLATLLVAWSLFLACPAGVFGVLGFVWYMNKVQIASEEQALRALFGREFEDYQSKVRRWF